MSVKIYLNVAFIAGVCAGCSDSGIETTEPMDDTGNVLSAPSVTNAEFLETEINGFMVSSINNFNSAGELISQASFDFNSDDTSISQFTLNGDGTSTEVLRFFLDERGLVNQINELDNASNSVSTQTLERDSNGKLIRFEDASSDGGEVFEFFYANNRIVSRTQFIESEGVQIEGAFTYDTAGHLASIEFVDSEANVTNTITYTNDNQGNPVRADVDTLTDGVVDLTLAFAYDESGNIAVIDRFNSGNNLTSRRVFTYESVDQPITNVLNYSLLYFP